MSMFSSCEDTKIWTARIETLRRGGSPVLKRSEDEVIGENLSEEEANLSAYWKKKDQKVQFKKWKA